MENAVIGAVLQTQRKRGNHVVAAVMLYFVYAGSKRKGLRSSPETFPLSIIKVLNSYSSTIPLRYAKK